MKKRTTRTLIVSVFTCILFSVSPIKAQFVHPGIWHKKSDLDRMKRMVEAKIDPWYTSYLNLKTDSKSSFDYVVQKDPDYHSLSRENPSDQRNEYESDARAAYQLSLMWYISGDTRYADKAVEILNAWSALVNFYGGGTEPLSAGIYGTPLINAAEIIKSTYSGWSEVDIQAFKDMLVYPGYSNTTVPQTDIDNDNVTFYWRTYNGDPGRAGNQGLLAWRTVMSIGIFLDNEIIYDRALRQIQGMSHRSDDIPYPSGPPINGTTPNLTNEHFNDWPLLGRESTIEDYGYDDQIQHYILESGQCEESSRDQVHSSLGLGAISDLVEIAWNQGDDVYSYLDDRLLLGLEFTIKYNLSYEKTFPDQPAPWEPTVESGEYISHFNRTGRREALKINPYVADNYDRWTRGLEVMLRPVYEMPLAHYNIREDKSDEAIWLNRARDYAIEVNGYEQGSGLDAAGWGGLSFRRPSGCAGDPIINIDSDIPEFSMHDLPTTIEAENYDFFSGEAEGRTYHDATSGNSEGVYRSGEDVDLKVCTEGGYNVEEIASGEWLKYTVSVPADGFYDITIRYAAANGDGNIKFNFGGIDVTSDVAVPFGASNSTGLTDWQDLVVASGVTLTKGVQALQILFSGEDNSFELNNFTIDLVGYACQTPVSSSGFVSGINYNYYEGTWDELPTFDFLTPVSTGSTSSIDLTVGSSTTDFGLVFDGYFNAPEDGDYTFYTNSVDGSRLYIDDIEIVDNDGIHTVMEASGLICLNKGVHRIKVEYFTTSPASSALTVTYEGPDITKDEFSVLYADPINIALDGTASQSSTNYEGVPERAIDGDTNGDYTGGSVTHTNHEEEDGSLKWWQVDLGSEKAVWDIKIYNRTGYGDRLNNYTVSVINSDNDMTFSKFYESYPDPSITLSAGGAMGNIVRISKTSELGLSLAEVQVFAGDEVELTDGGYQTITFEALPAKEIEDTDFTPVATASSGLDVSYTSSDETVATILDGNIHIVGKGTVNIIASQEGNDDYYAAADISQVLTVDGPDEQTITFEALPLKVIGEDDFSPEATASSGLTVSYTSSDETVATILDGNIHIEGAGMTTITASQIGNDDYHAAIDVSQVLTVSKKDQTITFGTLPSTRVGDADFSPAATASSGLDVSYTSSDETVATILENNIHIVGAGATIITASQIGDENYDTATMVTQTLIVLPEVVLDAEGSAKSSISLYPNPSNDVLIVQLQESNYNSYQVYNINGKTILNNPIETEIENFTIDLTDFMSGIYLLKFGGDESGRTYKIIKN